MIWSTNKIDLKTTIVVISRIRVNTGPTSETLIRYQANIEAMLWRIQGPTDKTSVSQTFRSPCDLLYFRHVRTTRNQDSLRASMPPAVLLPGGKQRNSIWNCRRACAKSTHKRRIISRILPLTTTQSVFLTPAWLNCRIAHIPVNAEHLYNIYTTLAQRRRRWANVV